MKNRSSTLHLLLKHKLIDRYGEPDEDAICEIALEIFCDIAKSVRQGRYSAEQIKQLMRDCESSDDWSNLSFFLQGYYTGSSTQNDVRWAVIHNDWTFYVYRYYLGEMVECLDQILQGGQVVEKAVHE